MARRQAEQIGRAKLAVGIDHAEYFAWVVVDRLGLEPDHFIYGYREKGTGLVPTAEDLPDWTQEKIAGRPLWSPLLKRTVYPFRFELQWRIFEQYHPKSAEELAAAHEKLQAKKAGQARERQARALAQELEENPLFGHLIREETAT
jgi:hypothetical protein